MTYVNTLLRYSQRSVSVAVKTRQDSQDSRQGFCRRAKAKVTHLQSTYLPSRVPLQYPAGHRVQLSRAEPRAMSTEEGRFAKAKVLTDYTVFIDPPLTPPTSSLAA